MAETTYELVFQGGILDGFERGQVMQRFGEMFSLPVEDVEKVFGHPRVVLKRNLADEAARALHDRLVAIGMAVHVHPPAATPDRKSVV